MRTRILISAFCFLLSAFAAQANLTNLVRETFTRGATSNYTATSTGAFHIVTGTLYSRAVGPRLTTDTSAASQGWSARIDSDANSDASYFLTNSAPTYTATSGVLTAWFNFNTVPTGPVTFMAIQHAAGNNVLRLRVSSIGEIVWLSNQNPFNGTNATLITFGEWYEFTIAWRRVSGNNFDTRALLRATGAGSKTLINAWTNVSINNTQMAVTMILNNAGAGNRLSCRAGMFSVSDIAAIGDASTIDANVVDPPAGRPTWFVNPSTGNDTNTGVTISEAWQTAGKVNQESATHGLMFATNYVLGPTLAIDTSAAVLDESATNLTLATRGLNVKATNAPYWTNLLCRTLTNSLFVAHALPNVYHQPVNNNAGFGQSNIVVWEDEKWMYHPAGGTFASISNYMVTNAGSFWTDGATNYLHPFGNSNPTSDGKVYTRSVARSTDGFASAINLNAGDMNFRDCYAGKTSMVRSTDNTDGLGAYVLASGGSFGGTSVIARCCLYYGAKHTLGLIADADDSDITIQRVTGEQGYPSVSSSVLVSYMGGATKTNNTHRYLDCTVVHDIGQFGSTNGAVSVQAVLYMHNNGSGVQFREIIVSNCVVGGKVSVTVTTNAVIRDSTLGGIVPYATLSNIIERVRFTGVGLDLQGSGSSNTVVRNCVAYHTNLYQSGIWTGWNLKGPNLLLENLSLDFSGITDAASSGMRGVIHLIGPMQLAFRNNVVKMGLTTNSVFDNFSTNSTFTISNNVYQLGGATNIAANYTNSAGVATQPNLGQWQALGFDANSVTNADVRFDSSFRLYGDSPARDFGVSQGVASDFTGALFPNRNDAGAMEYRRPKGFRFQ